MDSSPSHAQHGKILDLTREKIKVSLPYIPKWLQRDQHMTPIRVLVPSSGELLLVSFESNYLFPRSQLWMGECSTILQVQRTSRRRVMHRTCPSTVRQVLPMLVFQVSIGEIKRGLQPLILRENRAHILPGKSGLLGVDWSLFRACFFHPHLTARGKSRNGPERGLFCLIGPSPRSLSPRLHVH